MRRALWIAGAALAFAPAAHAGGPGMLVGVTEDSVKQADPVAVKAKVDLLRLVGFNSLRVTVAGWGYGLTGPSKAEVAKLQNVAAAARLDGMRLFVSITNDGSRNTPLTDKDREQFAQFAAAVARALPDVRNFVIGNEPNLNRFWLPQFNPDGSDAAAPAYEALLAETYDALKAVSPQIVVIGGAVSPRGVDKPNTGRDTHSPSTFIPDMGAAYRASGRTTPIMDWFAFHPYMENSSLAPTFAHPLSSTVAIADYGKLETLLANAFDGTAQPGSMLPILYDEFGVESTIPAAKAPLYTGVEPATTKPVDETTQGSYYRQAISLAFCQPNIRGLLLFHGIDEPALDRWQSGVYYADDTPKTDLPAVQSAVRQSLGGVITRCPGLALTPKAKVVFPTEPDASGAFVVRIRCNVDCAYYARLEKLPAHSTTLAVHGRVLFGITSRIAFPPRRLAPGLYRFTLRLAAPVNPAPPTVLASDSFRLVR